MAQGTISAERLLSFLQRIERLEEEKAALAAAVREIYAEARGAGFDPKIVRKIVRLRAMDDADRQEEELLLRTYLTARGMDDHRVAAE